MPRSLPQMFAPCFQDAEQVEAVPEMFVDQGAAPSAGAVVCPCGKKLGETAMSVSEYTRRHSVSDSHFHMSWSGPCFVLRDRGQEWFLEWHYYGGPTLCDRRTHGPRKTQPPQKSRFWMVARWWFDQGGKVEDGVGVWKEPPIIETRWKKFGRKGLIRDDAGDVVLRHYEGYESWKWEVKS